MGNINLQLNLRGFTGKSDIVFWECGEEHCLPDKLAESGKRVRFSVHLVLHGNGFLEYAGKEVRLGKGECFAIFENEDINYRPDRQNPWSYAWFTLVGKDVDKLLNLCGLTREAPHIRPDNFEKLAHYMREMVEEFNFDPDNLLASEAYFILFADTLIKNRNKQLHVSEDSRQYQKFKQVEMFLRDNCRLRLTSEDIAVNNCISVSYLMALFKKYIDIPVMEYLNTIRISNACRILYCRPDIEIKTAAEQVGFKDPLYFSRVFSKTMGMSPLEYCKKHEFIDPLDKFDIKR